MIAMAKSSKDLESKLKEAGTELERLERVAKLDEIKKMTDPLQRQTAALRLYTGDLNKASVAHKEHLEHQKHLNELLSGGLLKKLFSGETFFAVEMGKSLFELGEHVVHLGMEFAETAVEAAQFKNQAMDVFDLMLGGKEASEEEFGTLEKLVKGSSLTKQAVLSQYQEMFAFTDRYGVRATEDVIAAGADIQKALGNNASNAFLGVVRNIEAMGGLNQRTIRQLRETGIATPTKVYDALAADLRTTSAGAQALIKAGKISQEQSINTLLKLVQTRLDKGGSLGSLSLEKTARNVKDQLKNVKEGFESIFQDLDIKPLADALANLAEAFEPGTESGQRMREVAKRLFDDIGKGATWAAKEMPKLLSAFETLLGYIEKTVSFMDTHPLLAKMMIGGAMGGAVGGVYGAVLGAAGGLGAGMGEELGYAKQDHDQTRQMAVDTALYNEMTKKNVGTVELKPELYDAGANDGQGYIDGLSSTVTPDAVKKLFQDAVLDASDSKMDRHSPSRVMMGRGTMDGRGYNIGFRDEMRNGAMFSAGGAFGTLGTIAPDAPNLGGSGKSVVVNAHTEIKFEGQAPSNPQQQADLQHNIDTAVQRGIMRAMEQLGTEN